MIKILQTITFSCCFLIMVTLACLIWQQVFCFSKISSTASVSLSKQGVIKKTQSLTLPDFIVSVPVKLNVPVVKEVSFIAVGDIMLARNVEAVLKKSKNYNYPYLEVADYLQSADFVFGNLETSLTEGKTAGTGSFMFRADPENAKFLKQNNFKVLSLANNHSLNFGQKGIEDTFKLLSEQNILYVGAGKNENEAFMPIFLEYQGFKIAFLAYSDAALVPASYLASAQNPGIASLDVKKMETAVNAAKQQADWVAVSMHAGVEYTTKPTIIQENFAHAAIDAGADLVLGHHSHWVQEAEKYKGKYIFYGLGNFIFDQMWSKQTREGLAVKFVFDLQDKKLSAIELTAVLIENYAQPRILPSQQAALIFERLKLKTAQGKLLDL